MVFCCFLLLLVFLYCIACGRQAVYNTIQTSVVIFLVRTIAIASSCLLSPQRRVMLHSVSDYTYSQKHGSVLPIKKIHKIRNPLLQVQLEFSH